MQQQDTNAGHAPRVDGASAKPDRDNLKPEKWPPHLLQARGFRPNPNNSAAPVKKKSGRMIRYVAVLLAAGGIAWGVHALQFSNSAKQQLALAKAAPVQVSAQAREMQKLAREEKTTLTRVLSDLRILQSAFANLQGQVANLPPRSDLDAIRTKLAAAAKSLSVVTKQTGTVEKDHRQAIDAMKGQIASLEKAGKQRFETLSARLAKLETPAIAAKATSSAGNTSKIARTQPGSKPKPPGLVGRTASRRRAYGYVLRDAYRGGALIENDAGEMIEVYPGVNLPGAGRVRSISRRGGQWVVVTSRGLIDSQP